jgi:hypothetical protein
MTPEQLASYNRTGGGDPKIHVSDLDAGDHTLTTGYNLDYAGDLHAYVMDDEIHVVVYDEKRLLHHQFGDAVAAIQLRPSKRAYPHTTNETFALLMRNAGEPLTFLGNFDWERDWVRAEMAAEPFKAPTHLDF